MKDTSSPLTLTNRTAVITGGSRNIGFAIAESFAKAGMDICILSLSTESSQAACEVLRQHGAKVLGLACDLKNLASIDEALQTANSFLGKIDVLVNCAGLLDLKKIPDLDEATWDEVLSVNLKGAFFMTQKAVPYLAKSHSPRIINISSNSGRMGGFENGMAYTASKGGLIALTYGLARQLANLNITVNCIAPGTIDSDMLRARDNETITRLLNRFPLKRFGKVEEIAAAACYFASEESAFTTGAVLDVNGGLFMG
jgi:NAD(P)-dependent dehydrogenase (short-subunit alcohol dehydrogenase family)